MTKIKIWLADSHFSAIAIVTGVNMLFVGVANAANAPIASPITDSSTLLKFLCNIVGYFFWFLISLSVLMLMYAAYNYVTAGDDTEKTSKARRIITYAAIGIAVAVIANGFPSIVNSIFTSPASGINTSTC